MTGPDEQRLALFELVTQLGSEGYAVERMRDEMDERGWTQVDLAKRLKQAEEQGSGKAVHQGVLSKLLRGERGRHLSIEQLIALSAALTVPIDELLLPADVVRSSRGWRRFMQAVELRNDIRNLSDRYEDAVSAVRLHVERSPKLGQRIEEYLERMREQLEDDLGALRRIDRNPGDGYPSPEEWDAGIERNATPAMRAAMDVLHSDDQGESDE